MFKPNIPLQEIGDISSVTLLINVKHVCYLGLFKNSMINYVPSELRHTGQ